MEVVLQLAAASGNSSSSSSGRLVLQLHSLLCCSQQRGDLFRLNCCTKACIKLLVPGFWIFVGLTERWALPFLLLWGLGGFDFRFVVLLISAPSSLVIYLGSCHIVLPCTVSSQLCITGALPP